MNYNNVYFNICFKLPELTAESAEEFCIEIIEKTSLYAAAFKPNIAFFEAFGPEGLSALKRVIQFIPSSIPIILDNKRGDIDTTAQVSEDYHYIFPIHLHI